MKREYTYETGIACDPNKRDTEEDDIQNANEEDRIQLGNLSKNKPRKQAIPSGYRN